MKYHRCPAVSARERELVCCKYQPGSTTIRRSWCYNAWAGGNGRWNALAFVKEGRPKLNEEQMPVLSRSTRKSALCRANAARCNVKLYIMWRPDARQGGVIHSPYLFV